MCSLAPYNVQDEINSISRDGIFNNPLISAVIPPTLAPLANGEGSPHPSILINWRFAESAAALKAFEATMLNLLLTKNLFLMSSLITHIIDEETSETRHFSFNGPESKQISPDRDLHGASSDLQRALATNIYRTADNRYFHRHRHSSMNAEPTLSALSLALHGQDGDTFDLVAERIQAVIKTHQSATRHADERKTTAKPARSYSSSKLFAADHGKANAHVGLYGVFAVPGAHVSHPSDLVA